MPDVPPEPLRFADTARAVAAAARRLGLTVPVFVSPPRLPRVARTLRRRADGTSVVAVRLSGRPPGDVANDLVDGVLATNRLVGPEAESARTALLAAAGGGAAAA